MWDLRRVSGCSRPSKIFSIAQKWAKIAGIRQKLAGSMEKVYSHVVSAHKLHKNAFCEPKKFYRMLRRPPATYWRLKNGIFLQKMAKMKKNGKFSLQKKCVPNVLKPFKFHVFQFKRKSTSKCITNFVLVMFTCEPFVSDWFLNKNLSCVVKSMLSNFRHFMFLHFLSILLNHRCMWSM